MEATQTMPEAGLKFILAESHFNQDVEGWSKVGDSFPLIYNPTAGNPGGCLEIQDKVLGDTNYFIAAEAFLGDKRAATGLSFDIRWKHQLPNGNNITGELLVLTRGERVLKYFPAAMPSEGSWVHIDIPLSPVTGWKKSTGEPATSDDFRFVLTNLKELKIRSEYYRGGEIDRLDNVVMYVVKSPPTL